MSVVELTPSFREQLERTYGNELYRTWATATGGVMVVDTRLLSRYRLRDRIAPDAQADGTP